MNNIQKRFLLFLCGCIVIRLLFAIFAKSIDNKYLPLLGYIALIPVIGWFYIIFIGKRDTGGEVFGERIWWKKLRIIHMGFWLSFAYLAINHNSNAWILLFSDTMFGLLAFLVHHYKEDNYKKLIYE